MELLNNIWNALSTPNEGIINVIMILATLIESILSLLLFTCLLNISPSRTQKISYVFFSTTIGLVAANFIPSPFNTLINFISSFLIVFFLFKQNILKTFIAVLSPMLIFGLTGSLILNPYLTIFHLTYEQAETIPIFRLLYILIMYTIILIIMFLIKSSKSYPILNLLDDIDKKNKYIILFNFIFGILALIVQAFISAYYIDNLPIIITFLSFLSLLAYFGISIYSLTRVTKLSLTTKKLESAEEYNKTLHILHDSVRGFKHDFDNIVTTIGGYVKTNDMEGLKNYYVQLEDDCQKVNNLYLLNPEVINNPGIYNLLTNKYNEAISKDIKVNMSILLDLSNLKMKIYEFARILGILLDNAIEASQECEEKIMNITFRNDEKNHRQLIIIENTYPNKDVDTIRIFGKGISEKENHSGLGLWEVQNILKKNNNISLFTTKTDKYFKQQLEIYY